MPTYQVEHVTHYKYEEQVPIAHHLAYLLARNSPAHEWTSARIEMRPQPATYAERIDYFGNRLSFFAIQESHRELHVAATSTVKVDRPEGQNVVPVSAISWEEARDALASAASSSADLLDAFQFTFPSPCIHGHDEVIQYASPSFAPNRPLVDAVLDLMRRIHSDFAYDPTTTTITTTLPEILKARAGVCQDFAHLQIGCLRALGLAARYVSGYLLTTPPPGKPRLVGADASHAWLAAFIPGVGWLDLDPTNNVVPTDKHITIAWGRDFGDVSPLRGVILGGGAHTVEVHVDVAPIAPSASDAAL